jgi:hypothetical protein
MEISKARMRKSLLQIARHFGWGASVALAFVVVGCSTTAPDASIQAALIKFDGRWQLDRQASDDVRARLAPLFAKNERKWDKRAARFEFDEPPLEKGAADAQVGPRDDGMMNWLQRERRKEIEVVLSLLLPATQLEIRRSSDRSIRIATNKGDGARIVTLGETSSLFLAAGSFVVSTEWRQGGLQIESRGTGDNKLHIVERFVLRSDGAQLEEFLTAKIPGVGKQSFHIVYRRG